jgi:fatty-acid desaturase
MCDGKKKNKNAPGATRAGEIIRPWYRKGGMSLNGIGMAFNIFAPVIFLASDMSSSNHVKTFVSLLLLSYLASILTGRTTVYCVLLVPTYLVSLLLVITISEEAGRILTYLCISLILAIAKVNICMSVCLHRYAAHAAFKCGPVTHVCLALLGCLANQGGPIWWASQHRCHHKYCDEDRDPHSPTIDGTEAAFGFFQVHSKTEEEFAPPHMESLTLRVIDTWAFAMVSMELMLAYFCFGQKGLFIAYTSGWICQTITLWFNVTNHPPLKEVMAPEKNGKSKVCKATNDNEVDPWKDPAGVYLPFVVLNGLVPLFAIFVMELEHEHHHDHPRLAKRSKYDIAYWGFVFPLEQMGLVWNVVV